MNGIEKYIKENIEEFDAESNLMRLIEVEGLRYTHLDHCEIRDLNLPKE